MKRHDTHLLSDGSEKEDEEDEHKYLISSKNSSEENNDKYKNLLNYKSENNDNVSIISSSEIENMFNNETNKRFTSPKIRKPKINRYLIKLKKIQLNKEKIEQITDINLTYNPSLKNALIDNNIKKNKYNSRRCLSLSNKNKYKLDNFSSRNKKEVLYYVYKNNASGNLKIKNFINILNKQKMKYLQISNNSFSLNAEKKIYPRNNFQFPFLFNNNNNIFSREVKIRKNINLDYNMNLFSPKNNSSKNSLFLNQSKKLKLNDNSYNIFTNKIKYEKTPRKSTSVKSKRKKKIQNKIEFLYNAYIGKDNYYIKNKFKKIKSNESLLNKKEDTGIWVKLNSFEEYQNYLNSLKKVKKNNNNSIRNLLEMKTRYLYHNHDYNKHFGSNDSCPVCKAKRKKDEERIKKLGIQPMIPNIGFNNMGNSWKNRRVYSALSRVLNTKTKLKYNDCNDISDNNFDSTKSKNISISDSRSKIQQINKSKLNSSKKSSNLRKKFKNLKSPFF